MKIKSVILDIFGLKKNFFAHKVMLQILQVILLLTQLTITHTDTKVLRTSSYLCILNKIIK